MTEQELKEMKLHDSERICESVTHSIYVMRVVGGWIYSENIYDQDSDHPVLSTTFVPEV